MYTCTGQRFSLQYKIVNLCSDTNQPGQMRKTYGGTARIFYNAAAYGSVEKEYRLLYPLLKKRAAFLFEYGHILPLTSKRKVVDHP